MFVLEGKEAKEFIKRDKKPLTKKQKEYLKRCRKIYEKNPI
nr:MAG: hypothetical protein [Lokiarchaeota virus Fenrir Meg22_1012]URC17249.1 MAG: hypothetical protein [Lokiarchaeota virus Fenrir Meg22_1214]